MFFCVGKTGTSSIEKVLAQYQTPGFFDKKSKHIPPQKFKSNFSDEEWEGYYKFAFVRNPWDWVLSNYYYNCFRKPKWIEDKKNLSKVYDLWAKSRKFNAAAARRSISELRRFKKLDDADTLYQHRFLADPSGKLLVDFIGRYESLQPDFNHVCSVIGIAEQKLPKENVSLYNKNKYREKYTNEAKMLITRRYKKDIEFFDYEF